MLYLFIYVRDTYTRNVLTFKFIVISVLCGKKIRCEMYIIIYGFDRQRYTQIRAGVEPRSSPQQAIARPPTCTAILTPPPHALHCVHMY
jgi:hypothetical protein